MGTQAQAYQFRDLWDQIFTYTNTAFDPANAATGSGTFASTDITMPGVQMGDVVIGISFSVDTVDCVFAAAVVANNTVAVTLLNNTAGAVNLAAGTLRVVVGRPNASVFL